MPGADELLGSADVRQVGGAILFLGAATNVYDAFSAVMSSPWSTEKFSESAEEQAMAQTYVRHALVISSIYAAASAWMGRSVMPLIGAAGVAAYMYWLYQRALTRARSAGGQPAAEGENGAQAAAQQPTAVLSDSYPWSA